MVCLVWHFLTTEQINVYLQEAQPWETSPKDRDICLYTCAEGLRICAILLQPFMPEKMAQVLDALGVHKSARSFTDTQFGSDLTYGSAPQSYLEREWDVFPKMAPA